MIIPSSDLIFFCAVNILLAWSVYAVVAVGALSFASSAFMAIGCYASGLLTVRFGWPLVPALLVGSLVSAIASVPIGVPTLRLRGVFFILASMGVTISMQVILENTDALGGSTGFGGMTGATPLHSVIACGVVGALLLIVSYSPLQRILDAIREDSRVAESLGVNTVFVRVAAFAAGAAIAGYAGGLTGHFLIFVRPDSFGILVGIYATFYVILGGSKNLWGPALGAIVMTMLPEYFTVMANWRPTVFGVAIVVILLVCPAGILAFRPLTARLGGRPRAARLGAWRRA